MKELKNESQNILFMPQHSFSLVGECTRRVNIGKCINLWYPYEYLNKQTKEQQAGKKGMDTKAKMVWRNETVLLSKGDSSIEKAVLKIQNQWKCYNVSILS